MLLLLPLAVVYGCAALHLYWRGLGRREACLYASLPLGFGVVAISEICGGFHALSRTPVLGAWLAADLVLGVAALQAWHRRLWRPDARWPAAGGIACGLALLVVTVGVTAVLGAPNTWDSMQYHLPRVVMWAENRSLAPYPTPDYQQICSPPLAELAMLQTYVLTGNDRFVSLVQWAAWIGCMLGVSVLAGYFGASRRVQLLAAVIAGTTWNAVCAASGPKNDLVVSFWIVVTVCLITLWSRRFSAATAAGAGCAVGCALLSKGTAYAYLPCFFAIGLWGAWKGRAWRQAWWQLAVILVCAVGLNLPQYARNYEFSGSPLGFSSVDGEGRFPWPNRRITYAGVVGNVVRNLACHLSTRSPELNERIVKGLSRALTAVGSGPDVPGTTWTGAKFTIFKFSPHEIFATNPIPLALFLSACLVWTFGRRLRPGAEVLLFTAAIAAGFVMFAALLRYQPWNGRLHLPLFELAAVSIAIFLGERRASALAAVFLVMAVPFAVLNHLRPLAPALTPNPSILATARERVYFYDQHEEDAEGYIGAARAVAASGCTTVAIDASRDHFEYPLFAMLLRSGRVERVEYAGVRNRSAAYEPARKSEPCAVVMPGCGSGAGCPAAYGNLCRREEFGKVVVYRKPLDGRSF